MLDDVIVGQLNQPLDPKRITTFSQGPQKGVRYLEGEDVIRTANRIFGYGGWGYRLVGQPVCVEDGEQGANNTLYQVWTAHVELTVAGCPPISDLGTNTRQGKGAASLEMAIKGAVTDGIKRCLKTFGDQFGLVLYDKDVSTQMLAREYAEAHGEPERQTVQRDTIPTASAPSRAPREATGSADDWVRLTTELMRKENVTSSEVKKVFGGKGFSKELMEQWLAEDSSRTVEEIVELALVGRN